MKQSSIDIDLHKTTSFDFIRYACCWEDADILTEALAVKKGEKVLSIGSGGDNTFSLLANDPKQVVTVDINEVQLFLIELKAICIKNFHQGETLCFLGYKHCDSRIEMYEHLKNHLSSKSQEYWNKHLKDIESGVIHSGKFEKYLAAFAQYILPFIHRKSDVKKLLKEKSEEEQIHFFNNNWNTIRWRMFFRLFFSKTIMGKFGRDKSFLKEVDVSVHENILNKADKHLKSTLAQHNLFLNYCLTASFGEMLPHYLRDEIYEKIKANLDKLKLFQGYTHEAFEKYGSFDKMNLSNIFEYMDKPTFNNTADNIICHINKDGKVAYWNLMVKRKVSDINANLKYENELSCRLKDIDKGFFYNDFIVETKL